VKLIEKKGKMMLEGMDIFKKSLNRMIQWGVFWY